MNMHLSDCFIDLVAYVTYFLRSVESRQPAFERVKADIQRLVAASEENMKKGLVPPEDYDHARFAIFAWIDEMILASPCGDPGAHVGVDELQAIEKPRALLA